MRVSLVIADLGGGGAQRVICWLSSRLARSGHQVTLLTLMPGQDFFEINDQATRARMPAAFGQAVRWFDILGNLNRTRALRAALAETRPDVVVSFSDMTNVFVMVALLGSSTPIVVSERTEPRSHALGRRFRAARSLLYPLASRVVMVSVDSLRWAKAQRPRWDAVAIPNPARRPADAWKGTGPGPMRICACGRLSREKGADLLIRAFAAAAPADADWQLVFLGDGPLRQELSALAANLGLSGRVRFPGAFSSVAGEMVRSEIFVLPSRYEGFPNALAEAMALGMPVISFDCPSGPRELIRHEVDGLLVPPEDVPALARSIRRLMDDLALRTRLGTKAREVCDRFSEDRIAELWMEVIASAARRSG